jgi:hypothetical protein
MTAGRFEIGCELDAAFFHLYLPAENYGEWRMAEGETSASLALAGASRYAVDKPGRC